MESESIAAFAPIERRAHAKRRQYFVKKSLQARYVAYYLVLLLASSVALLVFLERRARLVLRTEMYKAHSSVLDTWSILQPGMARATLVVVAAVVAAAALVALVVSWSVHRASGKVAGNLRAHCRSGGSAGWADPGHPREFARLQERLVKAITAHEERFDRLHGSVESLREGIGALRELGPDEPACRARVLRLRGEFAAAARAFEGPGKEG